MASAEALENGGFHLFRGAHRGSNAWLGEPKGEPPFIFRTFYPSAMLDSGGLAAKLPVATTVSPPARIGSAPVTRQDIK